MVKVILAIFMFLEIIFVGNAFADNGTSKMILALENAKFSENFLSEKKSSHYATNLLLEDYKPPNNIYKIMAYLKGRNGKVPIYSVKEDRIRLELGVTGYIGFKYIF